MNVADQVAKWLLNFRHVAMTTPVMVKIGKYTFSGARYTDVSEGSAEERLYLVGELPACYRRSHKVCFRTADSEPEWYIASWFRMVTFSTEWQQVHRFGSSHFILALWSMSGGWTIDKFEPKAYRRVPMEILPAGPGDTNVTQPTKNENGNDNSEGQGP